MSGSSHFDELLSLALECEATNEQLAELKQLLRDDPDLLAQARQQAMIHGQLGVVVEGEVAAEKTTQQVLASIQQQDENLFVRGVQQRLHRGRWIRRSLAVAALLMLCLAGVFYLSSLDESSGSSPIMATLNRVEGVRWTESSYVVGSSIASGSSLKIDAGLLEMDLDGRGRLIVEGPAHLEFPESGKAVLHQGRIVMRATKKGHGYRIETPQGSIIDLGTEFGVSVGQGGVVETHVIEGSVEAVPKHGSAVTLVRDDAILLGESGKQSIDADAGKFYTEMPPKHDGSAKFIHWDFDENRGRIARARGELTSSGDHQADMVFYAMDQGGAPVWVPGVEGSALQFDGLGAYAESGYRGIEGGKPRTVSFWLKVPKDFSKRQGFGIISWGRLKLPGETWQISINPLQEDGAIGRLRLGLHGGQIIGSTDLRDGQWHHIAVVMYGGSRPNVGTHVLLYVDGEKEVVSRAALQEVRTEVAKAEHGVWIGRNVSYRSSSSNHFHGGFFRGELDELYIFDAALSREEVLELMKNHTLDQ